VTGDDELAGASVRATVGPSVDVVAAGGEAAPDDGAGVSLRAIFGRSGVEAAGDAAGDE